MSVKLRVAILSCFLVVLCQILPTSQLETGNEDSDLEWYYSFPKNLFYQFELHIPSSPLFNNFIDEKYTPENKRPSQDRMSDLSAEVLFAYRLISDEADYIYHNIEKFVYKQYTFKQTVILSAYDLIRKNFPIDPQLQDPIKHFVTKTHMDEDMKKLYLECLQTISSSGKKFYDYFDTNNSNKSTNSTDSTKSTKILNGFLKTVGKLEDSLLIIYQGMLGEHGSDSDILQATTAYYKDDRREFLSHLKKFLWFVNTGSFVLAHYYKMTDSESLSDWSKIKNHLLENEIDVKKRIFSISIEWASQKRIQQEIADFIMHQRKLSNNSLLAEKLYNYLASTYDVDYWFVIVYDALGNKDESGKQCLVGDDHHVLQINGKNIVAFHQSKYTAVRVQYDLNDNEPFNPMDTIEFRCTNFRCNLMNIVKFIDYLRMDASLDQHSLIALNSSTKMAHYFNSDFIGFYWKTLGTEDPFILYAIQSFNPSGNEQNPSETSTARSKTEL